MYTFTKLDDFHIRIQAPSGEQWTIKEPSVNYGFEWFIWEYALTMVSS